MSKADPAHPAVGEILVLHHSHLDVGYTHSQPVIWQLQTEYLTEVLDWLEQTADLPPDSRPKWTCEVTEPVRRWLREADGQQRERFAELARQGRIGLGALRWHVGALTDRPGLQRLIDGKKELEDRLGVSIPVACQHDVNGVPWPLADVLLDAGVDLLVMAVNVHLGRAVAPRPGLFNWVTPSGRLLRVFNGPHYTMFDQLLNAWDDSVERMQEGWTAYAEHLRDIDYRLPFAYLSSTCAPVMWDNAPPNPFMPDLIRRWNESVGGHDGPVIRYATFDDLLDRVGRVPDEQIPVLRGDWTDYWSFGYGSMPLATAVNQGTKPLLEAARRLGAKPALVRLAADQADLFDEHTFGYYITDPGHPQAQALEVLKQAYAYEGNERASLAVMDALERLAGNPAADKGISGVLVCNPTEYSRTAVVSVPEAWLAEPKPDTERTYRTNRMFFENRPWARRPGTRLAQFGPVELAPMSWQVIGVKELGAARYSEDLAHDRISRSTSARRLNRDELTESLAETGRIRSRFHELTYDPRTGRVLSLAHRGDGQGDQEVLAPRSGIDLLSFVLERPDPLVDGSRQAYYLSDLDREKYDESCWREWSRSIRLADEVTSCDVGEAPGQIALRRTFRAPGIGQVRQRIALQADDPLILIDLEFDLPNDASPHGIYFALPLALGARWRAAFDTAGLQVELDTDQLPGASRGWVTAESTAVMWDERLAVALISPDAPLVQFGGFHFGPPLESVPRPAQPVLLSWASNNYWSTNFPQAQAGRFAIRYALLTLDRPDHELIRRHSALMRNPVLTWPVTSHGRAASSGSLGS